MIQAAKEPLRENETSLDILNIRKDFPILKQTINGKPLVYIDIAASSHKPTMVINQVISVLLAEVRQNTGKPYF
jgi:selenocysteine lyase/cysteine desulfurase